MIRIAALTVSACLIVSGCDRLEEFFAPAPEALEADSAVEDAVTPAEPEPEDATGGPLTGEIAALLPLRGFGHEPGWHVRVDEDATTIYREADVLVSFPTRQPDIHPARMRFENPNGPAHVVFRHTICRDIATGMPHPYTVIARPRPDVFEGCGGDPETLFANVSWTLSEIGGEPFISEGELSIRFDDGRVSGASGCNRFMGGYALSGEMLTLTQLASTQMACSLDGVMEQETRLLDLLSEVQMFDLTDEGDLVLLTGLGETVTARREH